MYIYLKRFFDILVAFLIVFLLSPILIIICGLLLITGEHVIFYSQSRIGYRNQEFKILKFATMLKNSPNMGTGSITLRNDPRVTYIGRFLRKTKLNELPQVFNLMKGDMTLVGPRPHMEIDFKLYPENIQKIVFNVKPGITGIGSIVFRDQEQIFTDAKVDPHKYYKKYMAPYKGKLELWYQKNMSIMTDLKIIWLTALVILFPKSNLVFKVFKDLPSLPVFPIFSDLNQKEIKELS